MEKGKNSRLVSNELKETAQILVALEEKMHLLEQEGTAKPRWEVAFQVLYEDFADAVGFFEDGCSPMENLGPMPTHKPELRLHGWLVPAGTDSRIWCDCCMQKEFTNEYDMIESKSQMLYSNELLMRDLEEMKIAKRFWVVEFQFIVKSKEEAEALLDKGESFLHNLRDAAAVRSKAEFSGWVIPAGLKADLETPWTEYDNDWEGAGFLRWRGCRDKRREGFGDFPDFSMCGFCSGKPEVKDSESMESGKICFKWKDKVVGQVSPVDGDVFFPFVPFKDEQPKGEKFISATLENELDRDMLKRLQEGGVTWIGFPIAKYLKEKEGA